jgi:arylsulfatase A-like enzyme
LKIILVSMDTVRADHLSCYGFPLRTTPNLDRIASEGARFTSMFASDIPTQPAHTSIFTGRFGINTGIVSHFWPPAQLDPATPWLPELFEEQGWTTGAVDHLFWMKQWFLRGYTHYMRPRGRSRAPASVVNELAFPWLRTHADSNFFLFLHYWDAHIPYVPPSEFRSRFTAGMSRKHSEEIADMLARSPSYPLFKRNNYDFIGALPSLEYISALYAAEVSYLDDQLGRLVDHLEALGIYDDTMLVLFGDHGENMAEHDAWWDHAGLYDSVVHVPLIMRHPQDIAPAQIDAMIQSIDIFPTLCEAAGLATPCGTDGRSLWPLLRGQTTRQYNEVPLSECTWQATRGIRDERWKYIRCYDPGVYGRVNPQLYDVRSDPAETHNLAAELPGVVEDLDLRLSRWVKAQLGNRRDLMSDVIASGLPAVERLRKVKEETEEMVRVDHEAIPA